MEQVVLLYKLIRKVEFSFAIVPACLWLDKDGIPFDKLVTIEPKTPEIDYDRLELRPYQLSSCRHMHPEVAGKIRSSHICAESDADLCKLLPGSPIQNIRNESNLVVPYLVGLPDFRTNCDSKKPFLFFSRIAYIVHWINENL